MIIKSSRLAQGTTVEDKDGKLIVNHNLEITPYLENAYEQRKDIQNGWSKNRSWRKVASIDPITWTKWTNEHPELVVGDKELKEKTLNKLLHSEEGKMYWTVNKGV